MNRQKITAALKNIRRERDQNLKAQKLASLVSALFRGRGIELVVVGGSAIEFYTEGAYMSGDIDLCQLKPSSSVPRNFWSSGCWYPFTLSRIAKRGPAPVRWRALPSDGNSSSIGMK